MEKKLASKIVKISELNELLINQMHTLMDQYFDGVTSETFRNDLKKKKLVIILSDKKEIKGFSTMNFLDEEIDGQKVKAIFSGDTIIDKNYWGSTRLSSIWLKFVFAMIEHFDDKEIRLFWYLISMGYKTYRYLPVYFKNFYPRVNVDTPEFEAEIIDRFSKNLFKDNYEKGSYVIKFDGTREKLRAGISDVPNERLVNRDIAFFIKMNPGYINGDELTCLTELNMLNIKPKFVKLYKGGADKYRKLVSELF
ncbi:hypothetical protein KAJ27_24695 [bacterium]|nr:hypothetical protein [bacterium]